MVEYYVKYRKFKAGRKSGRKAIAMSQVPTGARRYRKGRKTSFYKRVQRAIMMAEETKYSSSSFSTSFAANNISGSGEGYSIHGVTIPTQGTTASTRTGNKWTVTGIHANCRVALQPQANTNFPITGQILLVKLKEGGATFPWGDFLNMDPITGSYSMNSLRNVEHYNDFVVLRKKRVYVAPDNFANNTNGYSFSFNWKGICHQTSEAGNPSVTASNSLFMIFLADTGFLSGTGNNYLQVMGTYNLYFKDA